MTEAGREGQAWRWERRMFNADEVPQQYSVYIEGKEYSPDKTWLIIGAGASARLRDYLNALEAQVEALTRERDELKLMAPYVEASGHYCQGMTEMFTDAQFVDALIERKRAESVGQAWSIVAPTDLGPKDYPPDDDRCYHWSVEDESGATVAIELNKPTAERIAALPFLEAQAAALRAKAALVGELETLADAVRVYSKLHNQRGSDGPCDCELCRALDRYDALATDTAEANDA